MGKTKVHEILGLEVDEWFRLDREDLSDLKYKINSEGALIKSDGCCVMENESSWLAALINGDKKIIRKPKLTAEQLKIIKALDAVGLGWVAKDKNSSVYAYADKPTKRADEWCPIRDYIRLPIGTLQCLLPLFPDWTVPLNIKEVLGYDRHNDSRD